MKISFTVFCLLLLFTSEAQVSLKGRILDSLRSVPLSYSTILLTDSTNKRHLISTSANSDGTFSLKIWGGFFMLNISHVGYRDKIVPIIVNDTIEVKLMDIRLDSIRSTLDKVTVSPKRPAYDFFPGKIIYNVQNDARSIGKNGLEILRWAPLISITGNESIQLKGSSDFIVLVNGKKSQTFSSNRIAFLQSIDQTQIEKIEIITTPSAKYSSEGATGIVNIVTRKNIKTFGGISFGYDTYKSLLVSSYLSGKTGRLGYSFNLSRNYWKNGRYDYYLHEEFGNIIQEIKGDVTPKRNNIFSATALSYDFSKKSVANVQLMVFEGSGSVDQNLFNLPKHNFTTTYLKDRNVTLGADFEQKIDTTTSLVVSYNLDEQKNGIAISRLTPAAPKTESQSNSVEHTLQIDLKKRQLEAGIKSIFRDLNTININVVGGNSPYDFKENIYAFYLSYNKSLKKINSEVGVRAEYTTYLGRASDSILLQTDYLSIFPTISLSRSYPKLKGNLSFGYSKRISRPQLYYLNPFINNSNPYLYSTGNSLLSPQYSNNFEVRFSKVDSKGNNHIFQIDYRYGESPINNLIFVTGDTVLTSRYENLRSEHILGQTYYTVLSLSKKIQIQLNESIYWTKIPPSQIKKDASNFSITRSGFYGSMGLNISGEIFKNKVKFVFSNSLNLPDVYVQGKGTMFLYQDVTFTYSLLKSKLRLITSIRQPFIDSYSYSPSYSGINFMVESKTNTPQRRLFIALSYTFGKPKMVTNYTRKKIKNDDKKNKNLTDTVN